MQANLQWTLSIILSKIYVPNLVSVVGWRHCQWLKSFLHCYNYFRFHYRRGKWKMRTWADTDSDSDSDSDSKTPVLWYGNGRHDGCVFSVEAKRGTDGNFLSKMSGIMVWNCGVARGWARLGLARTTVPMAHPTLLGYVNLRLWWLEEC